jgi:hypothetical protein
MQSILKGAASSVAIAHRSSFAKGYAGGFLHPTKWSDGESNPDLLNAIQPSNSINTGVRATTPPSNVCNSSGNDKDLQRLIGLWDTLPESARRAILATIQRAK